MLAANECHGIMANVRWIISLTVQYNVRHLVCLFGSTLPSPYTASFQAFSVDAFRDVSETNGRETPRQTRSAHV